MQHLVHICRRHGLIRHARKPGDPLVQQILQPCADHVEGQPEHQPHDPDKYRERRVFSRQHFIKLRAPGVLLALPGLDHRRAADLFDKREPHIRDGRRPVHAALLLHLADDMLQHLLLILVQPQAFLDLNVPFRQLARREPDRDLRLSGMVLDQMHDPMEASVDRPALLVLPAKIDPARTFLIFCHMKGVVHQLVRPFILDRRHRHHRDPQHGLHLIDPDGAAVSPDLIHHIQGKHNGNVQLHELHGQVQIPLDVGGIHNIDDPLGMLFQHKFPGHHLLAGIGRHGIDPRQICDQRIAVSLDHPVLPVHRDPRKIAHMLVGACKLVKKRGLPAVLVARQGKGQKRTVRQRMLRPLLMKSSALPQARVLDTPLLADTLPGLRLLVPDMLDPNFFRVRQTQRQLISVDHKFHRVAQRSVFDQYNIRPRNDPHIQKMLSQRALAAYRGDGRFFSDR